MSDNEPTTPAVPVVQQIVLVVALLTLLLGGAATTAFSTNSNNTDNESASEPAALATAVLTSPDTSAFADIALSAEATYVIDLASDTVLYETNAAKVLPLASITKLMTALVAYEILAEDDTVAIDETALRQDGLSDFLDGERFTSSSLTDLMLVSSSNDGAYALAVAAGEYLDADEPAVAFVEAMNIKASELGMNNTTFLNPSGLDISTEEAGSTGSAADVATLMTHIITTYPALVTPTTQSSVMATSQDGYTHEAINTNYYVDTIPGLLASKTGYTDLAGGNLVIAFDAGLNRPIVIAVLGSSRHNRFTDVLTLTDAAVASVSVTN